MTTQIPSGIQQSALPDQIIIEELQKKIAENEKLAIEAAAKVKILQEKLIAAEIANLRDLKSFEYKIKKLENNYMIGIAIVVGVIISAAGLIKHFSK